MPISVILFLYTFQDFSKTTEKSEVTGLEKGKMKNMGTIHRKIPKCIETV